MSALVFMTSCKQKEVYHIAHTDRALLPIPQEYTFSNSTFYITPKTKIFISNSLSITSGVYTHIKHKWDSVLGYPFQSNSATDNLKKDAIYLLLDEQEDINPEAYMLQVNQDRIVLRATSEVGLYNGLQTLWQLLPDAIAYSTIQPDIKWLVLGCTITDYPEYSYRGAMLDVARHFFTPDQVKRYIKQLAQYKINTLHLHLSDDQGWRIAINSWPDLTTIGGSTAVGGGKGGFYTQEEYKDIIAYAAAHYITIIPEIDMPGHTNAALASYRQLNCDDNPTALYTGIEVGFSSLCVNKAITYTFLDDVIGELAGITPGPYFHIGGDESQATATADYKQFINKAQELVQKHGKQVMGWEDISEATLKTGTVIQHWNEKKTAIRGIEQGAKVVLSPASRMYLDMQYDTTSRIGLHWAGYTTLEKAYNWKPQSWLDIPKDQILGLESPLWTETVTSSADIEYLVFPRIIAHAELGWSAEKDHNWIDFKARLTKHKTRLDIQDIRYYLSPTLENIE